MTRRESLGLMLLAGAVAAGRLIRRALLVGPDGTWRDPGFLDSLLPPLAAEAAAPPPPEPPFAVNTTTADTLTFLPRVGPVLAARIVAEREAGGPFRDAEDLQRVRGIGPKLAARLAPLLDFGVGAVKTSSQDSSAAARRR